MPTAEERQEKMKAKKYMTEKKRGKRGKLTLDLIGVGDTGFIEEILPECAIKRRLCDLGFCKGEKVECALASPLKDPRAYLVRGTLIALRRSDAELIVLRKE